jgi:hypothetical protein
MTMADPTPPTKSADMERSGDRGDEIGSAAGENRPDPNNPKPRFGPPPASDTNFNHPTAPGVRTAVPGAGVVGADADAFPKESEQDGKSGVHGGSGAPGASHVGEKYIRNTAPETLNAPLPGDGEPERPLSKDVPGINDPNFSARTHSDKKGE